MTRSHSKTRWTLDQWQRALWSALNAKQAQRRRDDLVQSIADDPVIIAPGRKEPHVRKDRQIKTHYIKPGSQWGSGYIESFHDKFGDECLEYFK